jgi:hypothetical protein
MTRRLPPARRHLVVWLLLGSIPALFVVWAVWWFVRPFPPPDSATTHALEETADHWWSPELATDPHAIRTIPESEWPSELKRLGPSSVYVCSEGVYLQFGAFFVQKWGLFVLPEGSTFKPTQSGDPSFRLLRGRVYRYVIAG